MSDIVDIYISSVQSEEDGARKKSHERLPMSKRDLNWPGWMGRGERGGLH